MVSGIETFREKFRDYADCFTVIGGTACDILMSEAGVDFRATRDIDMILLMEDHGADFAKVFWEYIREGGYRCGWKNSEQAHFYRFTEPVSGYPTMIELFSRKPAEIPEVRAGIVPIHLDDDISSLSAILLNDDFYDFMLQGRHVIGGIPVLDATYLIPFKMYAWLDLVERKAVGEHVNSRDLKKHRNDVFRLLQILPQDAHIITHGAVREAVVRFVEKIEKIEIRPEQFGLVLSKEEAIDFLWKVYLG